jgi:hypothetical protein
MDIVEKCYEVVHQLAKLEVETLPGCSILDDASKEEVLTIMDGLPRAVFAMLDDSPGKFGYEYEGREWHYKLRQVRNTPAFGKRMFAAFTE